MSKSGFLWLAFILLVSGCSHRLQPAFVSPVGSGETVSTSTKTAYENNYTVGVRRKAFVGGQMIVSQEYTVETTHHSVDRVDTTVVPSVNFKVKTPIGVSWPEITAGSVYSVTATMYLNGISYYVVPLRGSMYPSSLIGMDGSILSSVYMQDGAAVTGWTVDPANAKMIIKEQNVKSETDDLPKVKLGNSFELVFSGVTNNNIRILYREYTPEKLARTAFNQELTFDKSSKQIRFRNILMNVFRVSEQEIEFSIVSDR